MNDDDPRRWLNDDLNAALVVAATTLAVALTSCLWHHARQPQHPDHPQSLLSATLASLRTSLAPVTAQQSLAVAVALDDQKDHKSTRSKERRRRGKDPFRDLLKGGKKSKALLKAVKLADHDRSPDTLSNSSAPQNDTSTSRSQSPEPASDMDRVGVESCDGSARSMTPNGNSSSPPAVPSATDISVHGSSDAASRTDTHSLPLHSTTATDTEVSLSVPSAIVTHASEDAPSSPPSVTASSDIHMPHSRDSQAAYTSGSCAKLVRARTKLRLSRMDPNAKSPPLTSTPSPLPDSVASSFSSLQSIVHCPSLSITSSTYSTEGAGPPTPTNSRGSTPPPWSLLTSTSPSQRELNASLADSAQAQLASMRSALDAARVREEQLRVEAEQASKERDELRWGWNEDANGWRRREAELQAQIHHLMQQLQAYAAVASFQAQQASPFTSPTLPHAHMSPRLQHPFPLPPVIQTQNSASAPAHVQALLASAPVLASHPPGFAAPCGGSYSGAGFGMSPLLWSGMGLCVPNRDTKHGGRRTPDSSASGSSSGGRQRRRRAENTKNASDDSSLGDWDGMEDGSGDEDQWEEEEEDLFRNNVLADAILKRPESIRKLSSPRKRSSGHVTVQGVGDRERMDALKDPAKTGPTVVH